MRLIVLALFAFWWWALMRSYIAHGGRVFANWPISAQLTGKLSEPFDVAFVGIAAALAVAPAAYGAFTPWTQGIACVAAVSCIGTVATRAPSFFGVSSHPSEPAHIVFAGLAFASAAALFAGIGFLLDEPLVFLTACAAMLPALVQVAAGAMRHRLPWLSRASVVEWLTAIGISAAVAELFIRSAL